MKITRIEPIVVSVPYSYGLPDPSKAQWPAIDTLLVKVETDEGVTGWGEGFGFAGCATTATAVTTLIAPLCIGRDARDIAGLSAEVQRRLHSQGRNGPLLYGLSGVDIALWDIAGKVAGAPLYRLLGGEPIDKVPSYASLLRYGDPSVVARNAAEALGRGYRMIKLHEIDVPEVKAVRDAIGADIDLKLDTNCRWPPEEVLAQARAMEPFDLTWIEEPVWPPEDYRRLGEVASGTQTAIAAGENHTTLGAFERLIDVGKVRYVQPSVTKVGGITEMIRIVALAKARGVKVAPHSPYFGPGLVATVHICASLTREAACEQFYCELAARPFDGGTSARDGWVRVPDGPGLGVAPDHDVIARYRVG
jgi:D-galactarolactone cycloisomerase